MVHPKLQAILSILALTVVSPLLAGGGEGTGNVNFFLGQKSLDDAAWAPGDQQFEVGVETSWGKYSWPVLLAVDFFWSKDQPTVDAPPSETFSGEESLSTMELGLGFRKIWRAGSARPYWGAGVVVIEARQEKIKEERLGGVPFGVSTVKHSARGIGGWLDGGVFWRMTQRFNLGLAVRYSLAAADLLEYSVRARDYREDWFNAGGFHAGLILGWGWQPEGAAIQGDDTPPAAPRQSAGLVHLVVGGKKLKDDDWAPAQDQPELGIELSLGKRTWPVWIAIDYLSAEDIVTVKKVRSFPPLEETEDVPASTEEYAIGARWVREYRHVRGFVGVGLMAVLAERDFEVPVPCEWPCGGDAGWGAGIWTGGGFGVKIGPVFDLGLAARFSIGHAAVGNGLDPGGFHLGIVLGGGWPRKPAPAAP